MSEQRLAGPGEVAWRITKTCYFAFFQAIHDVTRVGTWFDADRPSAPLRAMILLTVLQGFAFGSATQWWMMLGGRPVQVTRAMTAALYVGLLGANYLALLRYRQWDAYLASFRALPAREQRRIRWAARIAVALAVVACAFTFYRFWLWGSPRWRGG